MAVSDAAILDAIETSLFSLPPVPGVFERLQTPGVRGNAVPFSHPLFNLIGVSTLTEENADETIARIIDRFRAKGHMFGWLVGPLSTPTDLAARLQRAGLSKLGEMAGMALTDLDVAIPVNPEVRVERATREQLDAAESMIMRSYPGMTAEAARAMTTVFVTEPGDPRMEGIGYLAYLGSDPEPVAFGMLLLFPGWPVAVLQGAATLPEHRGHGIYSALVAARLAEVRARGIGGVVIQAVRDTSAPICAGLGFREVCEIDWYAWDPATEDDHVKPES